MSGNFQTLPVFHQVSPSVFGPEEQYTRMSSSLLSATVRRLLIEATIYSWTVSGDPTNAGMHAHVAAFPYLDVTKISIPQPCLNFAVYSIHMLDVLLRIHTQVYSKQCCFSSSQDSLEEQQLAVGHQ